MDMQVATLDILTTKGRFAPETARAIGEAMDLQIERSHSYDKLATKEQLNETNLKLESVRTELKCDVERVKSEILRWMFLAHTGQAAVFFAMMRLFMPHGP
jgi:hypothetical protein